MSDIKDDLLTLANRDRFGRMNDGGQWACATAERALARIAELEAQLKLAKGAIITLRDFNDYEHRKSIAAACFEQMAAFEKDTAR